MSELEILQRQVQDMQTLLMKLQPAPDAPAPALASAPNKIPVSMEPTPEDFSTAVFSKNWTKALELLPCARVLSKELLGRIFVGGDRKNPRDHDVSLRQPLDASRLALWRAVLEHSKITPDQVNQLFTYDHFSTCSLIIVFGDAWMHNWLVKNSSPAFLNQIVTGRCESDDLVAWTAYHCNVEGLEFLFQLKTEAGNWAFPRLPESSWRLGKFYSEVTKKANVNSAAVKACIVFWGQNVAPQLP